MFRPLKTRYTRINMYAFGLARARAMIPPSEHPMKDLVPTQSLNMQSACMHTMRWNEMRWTRVLTADNCHERYDATTYLPPTRTAWVVRAAAHPRGPEWVALCIAKDAPPHPVSSSSLTTVIRGLSCWYLSQCVVSRAAYFPGYSRLDSQQLKHCTTLQAPTVPPFDAIERMCLTFRSSARLRAAYARQH